MDLVDDFKDMRSLIVPLFFVPLGKLQAQIGLKKQRLVRCTSNCWFRVLNTTSVGLTICWIGLFQANGTRAS